MGFQYIWSLSDPINKQIINNFLKVPKRNYKHHESTQKSCITADNPYVTNVSL